MKSDFAKRFSDTIDSIKAHNSWRSNECSKCNRGMVLCYTAMTIAAVAGKRTYRNDETTHAGHERIHVTPVACMHCKQGELSQSEIERLHHKAHGDDAQTPQCYDNDVWCAVDPTARIHEQHVETIRAWLSCRKPANYNEAFSEWE